MGPGGDYFSGRRHDAVSVDCREHPIPGRDFRSGLSGASRPILIAEPHFQPSNDHRSIRSATPAPRHSSHAIGLFAGGVRCPSCSLQKSTHGKSVLILTTDSSLGCSCTGGRPLTRCKKRMGPRPSNCRNAILMQRLSLPSCLFFGSPSKSCCSWGKCSKLSRH